MRVAVRVQLLHDDGVRGVALARGLNLVVAVARFRVSCNAGF